MMPYALADDLARDRRTLSCGLVRRIHAIGARNFGRAGWDEQRHRLIGEVTGGRTTHIGDLDQDELRRLLARLEELQAGRDAGASIGVAAGTAHGGATNG